MSRLCLHGRAVTTMIETSFDDEGTNRVRRVQMDIPECVASTNC
jgi:hypothetical protein